MNITSKYFLLLMTISGFFLVFNSAIYASQQICEPEIKILFDSGIFLEASKAYLGVKDKALKEGDNQYASKMQTKAAWSLYLHGKYHSSEPKKYYKSALRNAKEAIKLDAKNSDAYVKKGIALTFLNQDDFPGILSSVTEIREAFEKAIELDRNNVDGYLSLASWHAAFVSYVSNSWLLSIIIREDMIQKSRNEAIKYYDKSIKIAPNLSHVHLEYGRGLLLLNAYNLNNEFTGCTQNALSALKEAETHLEFVQKHKSQNELDRLLHANAKKLLERLKKDYKSCV